MQTKRKKNAISLFDLLLGLRCEFYRGIIHLSFIRRNEQKKKVSRDFELYELCERGKKQEGENESIIVHRVFLKEKSMSVCR